MSRFVCQIVGHVLRVGCDRQQTVRSSHRSNRAIAPYPRTDSSPRQRVSSDSCRQRLWRMHVHFHGTRSLTSVRVQHGHDFENHSLPKRARLNRSRQSETSAQTQRTKDHCNRQGQGRQRFKPDTDLKVVGTKEIQQSHQHPAGISLAGVNTRRDNDHRTLPHREPAGHRCQRFRTTRVRWLTPVE